ncbi:MAG: glycosyl hydrolase 53 family protein [Clostridiales bacterium]|nr:glycosyl hydrolase 53 family protein [Clostridiales bacterium]
MDLLTPTPFPSPPSATTCEQNESITFDITVTCDDKEIDLSSQSDIYLWIWADSWADGHSDGLTDCSISPNTGLANSVTIEFPSVGTYYIACNLQDSSDTDILRDTDVAVITVTESTADPSEEITTGDLSCGFMRGMDLSTFYTNWENGAVYYDYEGNEYRKEKNNAVDFFKFLYNECGVNWVRLRVWNDPYDEDGNPYGGGNNDVATAAIIGKWASEAGMTVLIDFHYSDFWADPGRQLAPKAWTEMDIDEKVDALYDYTCDSLEYLLDAGVNVGMVQVGNETNGAFCGEKITTWSDYDTNESWQNICALFSSGSKAVRDISADYGTDIKVALHFTNPNNANPSWYAGLLNDAGVDYDAMGISYYMYWHGTLSNLQNEIETISKNYGKEVFIAETAYPYTSENYDNCGNQVTSFDDFDMNANLYAISEAGQEAALTAILDTAANSSGCTGMFYWEPAWTALPNTYDEGTGWATKWASDYISYSMENSEGTSFDNQALFDDNGRALAALKFYVDYVKGVENLQEHTYVLDEDASTAATCTTDGENVYVCSVCGDSYTETVAATGHKTEIQNAKDATCTEDGYTGDEVCTVCSETITSGEVIPATGHTWDDGKVTAAATCTNEGVMTYSCTVCGDNKTEVISATGHAKGEAVKENNVDATCTEEGSYDKVVYCTVCDAEITRDTITVPATGHNHEAVVTAPTCTKKGYTTYTCSACGDSYTADETDATGHTAGEAVAENNIAATCTETGSYDSVVYCTVCNEELSRETVMVPATGHSYEATKVVAPTYADQGYTVYTCSVCGDSYQANYTDILVLDETDDSLDIRQKMTSLTAVPDGLTALYDSVDALIKALISQVTIKEGFVEENTAVYDVTLQYRVDGGTWMDATEENFPLSGITVTLPYPEGTDSSYEFNVVHMFTVTSERLGIRAGDIESPTLTKTEDGLVVTLTGLSPIAISWKAVNTATTETKNTDTSSQTDNTTENTDTSDTSADTTTTVGAQTGDSSRIALWLVLLLISVAGVSGIAAYHTKQRRIR